MREAYDKAALEQATERQNAGGHSRCLLSGETHLVFSLCLWVDN